MRPDCQTWGKLRAASQKVFRNSVRKNRFRTWGLNLQRHMLLCAHCPSQPTCRSQVLPLITMTSHLITIIITLTEEGILIQMQETCIETLPNSLQ